MVSHVLEKARVSFLPTRLAAVVCSGELASGWELANNQIEKKIRIIKKENKSQSAGGRK